MKRTAVTTIIRGEGSGNEVIVNGVIDKENARQRDEYQRKLKNLTEKHAREMAKLKEELEFLKWENEELKKHRNELLLQKYTRIPCKRNILSVLVSAIR